MAVLILSLIVMRREGYKLTLRGNYLFFAVFVVYGIVLSIIFYANELYNYYVRGDTEWVI